MLEFIVGVAPRLRRPSGRSRRGRSRRVCRFIGFLDTSSPPATECIVANFQSGLRDAGFIEGQNVAIEFRWGKGQPVMRQLASDLVRFQAAVIVASGAVASQLEAKAATSTSDCYRGR